MVSTSGAQLLPEKAVEALIKDLLPLTTILTPNLPEALLLLKYCGLSTKEPNNLEDLIKIATDLSSHGPKYVLLKGGHFPLQADRAMAKEIADSRKIVDVLCTIDGNVFRKRVCHSSECATPKHLSPLLLLLFDYTLTIRPFKLMNSIVWHT
jgi:hydroxymethylpyrimidine/phosphomethylpyrimidine kinase